MRQYIAGSLILLSLFGCTMPGKSTVKDYGSLPEALPQSSGELLFVDIQCTVCHGYQGSGNGFLAEGLATPPPDFSSTAVMNAKSDAELGRAIREGKGQVMPAYPRLTGQQVANLVRYIRSLSQTQ